MGDQNVPRDSEDSPRGDPLASRDSHTDSGAPTEKAHEEAGDGSLAGSIPAGLSPDELRQVANTDDSVESGTG